ncbi:hypothetical protein JOD54_002912 [Actinokineospora baliensis]|nr:hypothetical protein [Actinokineospora baliensis]
MVALALLLPSAQVVAWWLGEGVAGGYFGAA